MNRFVSSLIVQLAAVLAATSPLATMSPLAAAEPASWELTPYRIQLLIAAEPGGAVPRSLADDLRVDLPELAGAVVGGAWQLEAVVAPADLRHSLIAGVADVAADRLPAEALAHDKVILLAIADGAAGVRLQARELDVTTGLWNSVVTRHVASPSRWPAPRCKPCWPRSRLRRPDRRCREGDRNAPAQGGCDRAPRPGTGRGSFRCGVSSRSRRAK